MAKKKTTKSTEKPQEMSAAEKVDRDMALSAMVKQARGDQPTRDEAVALRRFEKADEQRRRWKYYRTVPKKHWREMSGRANQTISEQAERYGLPFGGPTIDLTEFLPAFHDFLAANKLALNTVAEKKTSGDELERLRKAQAEKVEMINQVRRGELRNLDDVRKAFDFTANIYRKAMIELRTEFGERACEIIAAAIGDADKVLKKFESHSQ